MKKRQRKLIWLEIRMVLLCAMLYGIYDLWATYRPENPYIQMALAVSCAVISFFLFKTMRDIWRRELGSWIGLRLKMLVTRMVTIFTKYSNKFMLYFRGKNVAEGKTEVRFDYSLFKTEKKKRERFKPPKWKDMKNGRQKLGFLYYKIISDRIDRGEDIYSSDTPSELKDSLDKSPLEEEIFGLYVRARYDEREYIDEDNVNKIKEAL